MIPIRDEIPSLRTPLITVLIIAATTAAFFFWQGSTDSSLVYETAVIPCELITGEPISFAEVDGGRCQVDGDPVFASKQPWMGLLYSLVLHGSVAHLVFNMWSLWIFGNNVEDAYGRIPFLVLYLVAGVVGSLVHVVLQPSSTIPLIGASGAIAGVMGAYLVLYPRARIRAVIPPFIFFSFRVPATIFLGLWFVGQFFVGDAGIAWLAHVGGFVAGMLLAGARRDVLLARLDGLRAERAAGWR